MDPTEIEFLAEKENVYIIPNFSQNKIFLISVRFIYLHMIIQKFN